MNENPLAVKNIILTGFMGTGKTAVGEVLARRLKRRFIDTDAAVETLAGLPVPLLFERFGETYFRDRESEVIAGLARYPAGSLIVATGGGAVLRETNRLCLQRCGVIVLLTASVRAIVRRTAGAGGRPLLYGAKPGERVRNLLETREPYYRQCDLLVDTTGKTPSRVAAEIIKKLRKPRDLP
ncbi:MAG: shikimate kinase [Bacillota bacterium]